MTRIGLSSAVLVLVMASVSLDGARSSASNARLPAASAGEPSESTPSLEELIAEGRWPEAEALARKLLQEAEDATPPDPGRVADALDLLVEMIWRNSKGAHAESQALANRAVEARQALAGAGSLALTRSLRNMAIVLTQAGDFEASRPVFERILEIRQRSLGPDHPEVAQAIGNLGSLMQYSGDYVSARQLYEQALAIRLKSTGHDSPETATVMGNLASVRALMGDLDGARALFEEASGIYRKIRPRGHPDVALGLLNLGEILAMVGDFERAGPALDGALRMQEESLDSDDWHIALTLASIGAVRLEKGDLEGASSACERALAIRERSLGPEHPWVARVLHQLGLVRFRQGRMAEALSLLERALGIQDRTLTPAHPDRAETLVSLARLHWSTGDPAAALDAALAAEFATWEQMRAAARGLPQHDAVRYAEVRTNGLDVALTILAERAQSGDRESGGDPTLAVRIWDQIVRSRALVRDALAERHRTILARDNPDIVALSREWDLASARLAQILRRGMERDDAARYRARLKDAWTEVDRAELALAARSASFHIERDRGRMGFQDARAALPEATGLLAYYLYRHVDRDPDRPIEARYMALVLCPGCPTPLAVPLGPAAEIDARVARWRGEAGADPRAGDQDAALGHYMAAGSRLRESIWDPLPDSLRLAKKVLIVPDGELQVLNFSTLPTGGGRYLLDAGPLLHLLSTERDLRVPIPPASPPGMPTEGRLLAIGGPDFDRPGEPSPVLPAGHPEAPPPSSRGACGSLDALHFDPLPASRREIADVARRWRRLQGSRPGAAALQLTGSAADEAAFKRLAPEFEMLHLATHGFFAGDHCAKDDRTGRERTGAAMSSEGAGLPVAREDPMLLSGLALAGANRRQPAAAHAVREDGLLTAGEIASLDLSAVRWAVLSACDTGLGSVHAGEGVLGLRRAFEIAGAGTLIMSLWSVEDEATRVWMARLYEARASGLPAAEAVRRAARDLLAMQRRRRQPAHPFFWGGFVAAGDWR